MQNTALRQKQRDMVGQYIQSIEVDELWHGGHHVKLDFQFGVNVLSGVNGLGKSTIISKLAEGLHKVNNKESLEKYGVHILLYPEDATSIKYNFIKSFDSPLMSTSQIEAITDKDVKTYLDWKIYKLQNSRNLLENGQWTEFCNLIDKIFSDTGKTIDRESRHLRFTQSDNIIPAYKLSAGEKNILIILLTVILQDREPCVLLLDEPEICLHIDWQEHLLDYILQLNPHVQLILSTHSPAIVMNGWIDTVTEISDKFI